MTLLYIVLATLIGGLLSVLIAASLTVTLLGRIVKHLVSLSTGVLLGTALLHVLPEAFESGADPHAPVHDAAGRADVLLPAGKGRALPPHPSPRGRRPPPPPPLRRASRRGVAACRVLVGDSIHNFCDGIIIAAAFLADPHLGLVTALAIIAHEIPQEVGDYIVLLNAGFSRAKALLFNAISGLAAVVGGVVGYFVVGPWESAVPVSAGGRLEQLRLRGRGRSDPAIATPPALARDGAATGLAGRGPGPDDDRGGRIDRLIGPRSRSLK